MYLRHDPSGNMVEILDPASLANPGLDEVEGRFHAGEELQDAEHFAKTELSFPSGEALPQCWVNPHYRH